jgi:hypothetical protein
VGIGERMKITITLEKDSDATEIYEEVVYMAKERGFGIKDIKVEE